MKHKHFAGNWICNIVQMYFYKTRYFILGVHILLLCENYIYCLCIQVINNVIFKNHFAFHRTILDTFQFWRTQVLAVLTVTFIASLYDNSGRILPSASFCMQRSVVAWSSSIPGCHGWHAYTRMGRSIVTCFRMHIQLPWACPISSWN